MLESKIEAYLQKQVKALGGIAYKFVSPGNSGVPDRLVLLPGGRSVFVELKAPGKKPTKLQLAQHRRIEGLDHEVRVLDSKESVDAWLQEL
ncbi:VRR-NUC domain-containing protein [Paenibacillus hubeiensis]|uniref:VRR-NUC domain-containing protein n=1 Tax=Paenibacillus hubeiensis TaxID=3077330 RepID=UPI0031B9B31A